MSLYATCDRLLVMRITADKLHAQVVYDGEGAPVWDAARPMQKNGQRSVSIHRLRGLSAMKKEAVP